MPNATLLRFPQSDSIAQEEPASRLRSRGADALGLEELVALSIGPQVAALFAEAGDRWHDLLTLDYLHLSSIAIDDREAVAFLATIELARRLTRKRMLENGTMDRPAQVASYLFLRYFRSDQEVVGALFLDSKRRLITDEVLFRGTMTRTRTEPRAVLKRALALNASSFILFHYVARHIMEVMCPSRLCSAQRLDTGSSGLSGATYFREGT